ncbi:MAG: tetratricopeptide repeat protein, partial [Desertifilum sp. SIO1I2]|nr:tetratricopeptide repeat protein [Desertifilum sp. SIO1I2]
MASYDRAILHNPHDYEAWFNRGSVLERLQRYEEAIAS